ncbi:MAG: glycosyltransferase family 4 protein [Bacteroidia bacterium]
MLHLFGAYLNTTENWAYRLMDSLNSCKIYIGSAIFLRHNFYSSKFTFIPNPLDSVTQHVLEYKRGTAISFYKNSLLKITRFFFGSYTHHLLKTAGKENIQLIHSHFSFVGYEYLPLSRKLNIPHLVSFYGFDYEWLPYNFPEWNKKYKKLFNEADLFICEGNYSAMRLQSIGCNSSKIRVVRLGVNPEKIVYHPRKKNPGELKLLQVAAFNAKKGHRHAVEAFAAALESCPNMTMTFVGKDGMDNIEQLTKELVAELKLEDKIFFEGLIDFEKLHDFMHDYQVFIHPSCHTPKKDCEGGAPVVLLDAQATGMPVISTNHCDIPDEVIQNSTGLLADEFDVEALAKHISHFYNMGQQEFDGFAKNAREHIEKNYDISKNALVLEDIYHEALQKRKNVE